MGSVNFVLLRQLFLMLLRQLLLYDSQEGCQRKGFPQYPDLTKNARGIPLRPGMNEFAAGDDEDARLRVMT